MSLDVKTYSAVSSALSVSLTGTDIFTITGANGVDVRVQEIRVSGLATTAGSVSLQVNMRSSANSAGTSSAPTAVPHDSNDAAAQATVLAYTANPTLGTAVGAIRAERLPLPLASIVGRTVVFEFGRAEGKPPILHNSNEVLALNIGGAAPVGASLTVAIEWTEQ